jgi:hypothetical protein
LREGSIKGATLNRTALTGNRVALAAMATVIAGKAVEVIDVSAHKPRRIPLVPP